MIPIADRNVRGYVRLPPPDRFRRALPVTAAQAAFVHEARRAIQLVLRGEDRRLLVIVGPCSIHDAADGREFARRLAALRPKLDDRLVLAMRAYVEKPRTGDGWPGLVFDPDLDGRGRIDEGLRLARAFLRDVLDLGLPTATEFLDPISPQYLADLVCWASIGARTSESQAHRQLASGLSMPVGCKNGTSGSIHPAVNAIRTASRPHTFLGIGTNGRAAAVHTRGNPDCHLVLRGGTSGPNYSPAHIATAEAALQRAGVARGIVVDCSHDNSGRQPLRQPEVARQVVAQVCAGKCVIVGLMLESHLFAGNQPLLLPRERLRPGVSITDPCLDWASTERCLRELHASLASRFEPASPSPASCPAPVPV